MNWNINKAIWMYVEMTTTDNPVGDAAIKKSLV